MNIELESKKLPWLFVFILFLVIALVCLGFIFAPVKQGIGDIVTTRSAVSIQGIQLMAESWKRYPQYTIGLGVAAGLSFAGACYSVYLMSRAEE